MGKWLWAFSILVFFYFIVSRHIQIEILIENLRRGIWYDLLLALLLQILFFFNQAAFYASLSRLTEHPLRARSLVAPVLAANFFNAITPTGLISGLFIIIDEARREGMTEAEALVISGLYLLLDYSAFLIVLAAGLLHLYLFHRLKRYELIPAGLLSAVLMIAGALLVSAMADPERTTRWILRAGLWARKRVARVRVLRKYSEEKMTRFTEDLKELIVLLKRGGRNLTLPSLQAFGVEAISLGTLYTIFIAFRTPVPAGTLITGYAIGTLFTIIAITPAGIGLVEGSMTLTFTSLGVASEAAAVVTLVYRGITFWLPFVVGFLAFRRLKLVEGDNP